MEFEFNYDKTVELVEVDDEIREMLKTVFPNIARLDGGKFNGVKRIDKGALKALKGAYRMAKKEGVIP